MFNTQLDITVKLQSRLEKCIMLKEKSLINLIVEISLIGLKIESYKLPLNKV